MPEGAAKTIIIISVEEAHSSGGVFLSARSAGLITVKLTHITGSNSSDPRDRCFVARGASHPAHAHFGSSQALIGQMRVHVTTFHEKARGSHCQKSKKYNS